MHCIHVSWFLVVICLAFSLRTEPYKFPDDSCISQSLQFPYSMWITVINPDAASSGQTHCLCTSPPPLPLNSQSRKAPNSPRSSAAVPRGFPHVVPLPLQSIPVLSAINHELHLSVTPVLRPLNMVWFLVSLSLTVGKILWLRYSALIFLSFGHSKY